MLLCLDMQTNRAYQHIIITMNLALKNKNNAAKENTMMPSYPSQATSVSDLVQLTISLRLILHRGEGVDSTDK